MFDVDVQCSMFVLILYIFSCRMNKMPDAYQSILNRLSTANKVLITTHIRPDGDALGSTAAMVLGLKAKGISATVLLLSHLPSKYAFIYRDLGIEYFDVEKGWPADFSFAAYDTLLVIDTGTWSQLPGLKDRLTGFAGKKLVVDHHLTQEDWADEKLVVTEAAAAGEIVAELLAKWEVPLTAPMARALYLALVSDTGWFQFSNTKPRTLRLAATLMEAGVDTDQLYQLLYQSERPERVTLQAHAQQSLELLCDNRLAVMQVSRQDFLRAHASSGDTEALINIPLQIATVQVSILLNEPMDDGPIRVSLRSKGQVDVARFAQQFGGGGHARAAGLKVDGALDSARVKVVEAMRLKFEERTERNFE
jgi:phosphoesterase RecJ-like protein